MIYFIPVERDNPVRKTPWLTHLLIGINVYIFLITIGNPNTQDIYERYAYYNHFWHRGEWLEVLKRAMTAAFLHGGIGHIFGNMLFLKVVGDNIEERLGKINFLIAYALMALFAALAQTWFGGDSDLPMVGASGAVSGLMAMYFLFFPFAKIDLVFYFFFFFWPFRLFNLPSRSWILILLWLGTQYLMLGVETGVAVWAHLGGFAVGLFLAIFYWRKRPLRRRRNPKWEF